MNGDELNREAKKASRLTTINDKFIRAFRIAINYRPPISDDKLRMLRKILHVTVALIPAFFIEFLALFTNTGLSGKNDEICLWVTHLTAVLSFAILLVRPRIHRLIRSIPVIISPFASFYMLEFMTHNPFMGDDGTPDMKSNVIWLNISLFIIALLALIFITGRTAPAVIAVTAVPVILGLINYFTLEFRGTPLFPWDLASYGTAASVISEYEFSLTPTLLMIIGCALLSCSVAAVWNIRVRFPIKFMRPVLAAVMCVVVFNAGAYVQSDRVIKDYKLYPYLFTPKHLYKTNGFAVSFLMNLRYAAIDKPNGYSADSVREIADDYSSDKTSDAEKKPNIIVIMNEAFADMTVLADYTTSEDCFPFISSLSENTVKGNLHVSIVGGNTPNSEFEFLTGMSMGFLPAGSIPYQQYITSSLPSLATQMNDLGYRTVAMHPYTSTGWERDTVYPNLGFKEMYFRNSPKDFFSRCIRLRSYISDLGLYTKIEQLYNDKGDDPLFIFAVTMQNHSSYSSLYSNFNPSISVDGLSENVALLNYMSLLRESDAAFEELVNFFSTQSEETIILMFGDHQPNDSIAYPLMMQSNVTIDESNLEESEKRYIVPYVVWSNFDINTSAFEEEMSLNYLACALLSSAELPMTASQKMLTQLMDDYPVINGRCFIDSDGDYSPVSDYDKIDSLSRYAVMQYNYLFGDDERLEEFFKLK
ncbi:MAG: LTA synthase family protein [Clostridia bacterium]|nr:LTA synthase family protein [Clostridia bacterium]